MSNRPKNKKVFSYQESIRGFYGQFKTDVSFPLSFVQSSIPIRKIDILHSANEVFSSKYSDFEQLIQRDIDQIRVKKIVNTYLQKGKDRVVFFPPLLVACMAVDNGKLVSTYENFDFKKEDDDLKLTWGDDRFQLVLPFDEHSTSYKYENNGDSYNINPYWANLQINTDKIKLVVIDGQHRLSALKNLKKMSSENDNSVIEELDIPICVLFSPDAISDNPHSETIEKDMRELFVRINSTSKDVSGHFITLLKDKSLSSHVLRDLCEKSKEIELVDTFTLLNLIEWNQREDRRSSQLNRAYSITSIKIIDDALKDHVFGITKSALKTKEILGLEQYKEDLLSEEVQFNDISEDNFTTVQINVIKERMKDSGIKISEALITLLTKPTPYKEKIVAFKAAVNDLDEQIKCDTRGAGAYKKNVLGQYREVINDGKTNKIDSDEVVDQSKSFEAIILEHTSQDHKVFFSNVFQQALIRVWVKFSVYFHEEGFDQYQTAKLLIKPLNLICFNKETRFFDSERVYLQKTIFNGSKHIVSLRSKTAWYHLILMTFLNKGVMSSLRDGLNEISDTDVNMHIQEIESFSSDALDKYYAILLPILTKDFSNSWRDKELPASELKKLNELTISIKKGDDDLESAKTDFEEIVSIYATRKLQEVKEKLSSVLGI